MSIFSIHTAETAPEASRPILDGAARKFSFVPNLLGALAEAPATLQAYDIGKTINTTPTVTGESKAILLGQGADKIAA